MTTNNQYIPRILTVLSLLEDIPNTELERASLTYKLQGYYHKGREGLDGIALIDELTDEELTAAIVTRDPMIKLFCGPHIDPPVFNYIRHNRPQCICQADAINKGE
jgi:hypothetical protein